MRRAASGLSCGSSNSRTTPLRCESCATWSKANSHCRSPDRRMIRYCTRSQSCWFPVNCIFTKRSCPSYVLAFQKSRSMSPFPFRIVDLVPHRLPHRQRSIPRAFPLTWTIPRKLPLWLLRLRREYHFAQSDRRTRRRSPPPTSWI